MKEVWRDIAGYEGLYQVSNIGRVKSLDRYVFNERINKLKFQNGRMLVLSIGYKKKDFYLKVSLSKDNRQVSTYVHRLVAEAFIPNSLNCTQVNHIDGDKRNNAVENLEWVTPQENKIHAVYTGLDVPNYGLKPVICINNGKVYPSVSEAARNLKVRDSTISKVCKGKQKKTKGLRFEYV